EAAAVTELAKAWDATGNTWLDGAIAGSGGVARPIIISRILGGKIYSLPINIHTWQWTWLSSHAFADAGRPYFEHARWDDRTTRHA
ncbi:MAG: hypothetical protein WAO67_14840, partial [Yoonia sp.]